MEEWVDINGYEGLYQISSFGNVKSLNYRNTNKEKIMRSSENGHGYLKIELHKNKKRNTLKIHYLVAISFIGHKQSGHNVEIDHIDGNKHNNNITNLRLISHIENLRNYYENTINKDLKLSDKTSNFMGVSWSKSNKKWFSRIQKGKKIINLGFFDNEIDAYEKYKFARENLKLFFK